MRWFLIFWGGPILFLGLWYGLSYYDMNFGIYMLRRDFHDLVFQIYGQVLGIAPETIPPLVAKAVVVDTIVLFGLMALRRRKALYAWWQGRRLAGLGLQPLAREDSLSKAP